MGTNELPLVVRAAPNDDSAERAAEATHREWELASKRRAFWLGVVMAVLAAVQLVYFVVQLKLMRRSMRDAEVAASVAKLAAEAASLNARAAVGIELPLMRAMPGELLAIGGPIPPGGAYGGSITNQSPDAFNAVGGLNIRNDGRTPAFLSSISAGWTATKALPEAPIYRKTTRLSHNAVVKANDEFYVDEHYGIELTEEERRATSADEAWLWFYGALEYRDFLNEMRIARFCWRSANHNAEHHKMYFFSSDRDPPEAYTQRS